MDVEASRAIRQAEVGAARTMIERTEDRFEIKPNWLAADTAYGSAPNLDWLVNDKDIAPYILSSTSRSGRTALSRAQTSSMTPSTIAIRARRERCR